MADPYLCGPDLTEIITGVLMSAVALVTWVVTVLGGLFLLATGRSIAGLPMLSAGVRQQQGWTVDAAGTALKFHRCGRP